MELRFDGVGLGNCATILLQDAPMLFDVGSIARPPGVVIPSSSLFDSCIAGITASAPSEHAELSIFLSHAHRDHFNKLDYLLSEVLRRRPKLTTKIYVNMAFDATILSNLNDSFRARVTVVKEGQLPDVQKQHGSGILKV